MMQEHSILNTVQRRSLQNIHTANALCTTFARCAMTLQHDRSCCHSFNHLFPLPPILTTGCFRSLAISFAPSGSIFASVPSDSLAFRSMPDTSTWKANATCICTLCIRVCRHQDVVITHWT